MDEYMTRRRSLQIGAAAGLGIIEPIVALGQMGPRRERPAASAPPPRMTEFAIDRDSEGIRHWESIHDGLGSIGVKYFEFSGAPHPANFLIYDIPPQASEGVHVHTLDDENGKGPFDEYYYILSGAGQMEIDGKIVPVTAGDHIHTPLGVEHGIENTARDADLRVFLTFILRS